MSVLPHLLFCNVHSIVQGQLTTDIMYSCEFGTRNACIC